MNIQEIYELGLAQGWDEDDAFYLAQIAWAESKGVVEEVTDEPDKTRGYGLWQINSTHLPKLIEDGILDVEGWGVTTDDMVSDEELLRWLAEAEAQLADPVINAEAAYYVGHHMDYSEPLDDWDWTRWNVTKLPETDGNHPSKYGSDVIRSEGSPAEEAPPLWHQVEVPDDFKNAVTALSEWDDQIKKWGLDGERQDIALKYVYNKFVNGFGGPPDEGGFAWGGLDTFDDAGNPVYNEGTINDFLAYGQGGGATAALAEVQVGFDSGFFGPLPDPSPDPAKYEPTLGVIPDGWLSFWGDDDKEIGTWFQGWEDIFEANRESTVPHNWNDLEDDFLADLQKQAWWVNKTENYRRLVELWYGGGGPGGEMTDGVWEPGAGWAVPPSDPDFAQSTAGAGYEGTGDWRAIWDASIEVIKSIGEDLGVPIDGISQGELNNMAWMLMRDGGAANYYNPTSTWADTAASLVERYIVDNLMDADGNLTPSPTPGAGLEAGTIQDIVDQLRQRANSQLYDIDDDELRQWALEIKTERGKNLAQRMAEIDAGAFGVWGLTPEQVEGMGSWSAQGSPGASISSLVNPLWSAATGLWDDTSYNKDDQWLMDNYQVEEDGVKRFRTAQEMRTLARTNLDRFQYSDEYQDPMNRFIQSAAAMFRSDY